MQLLTSPIINDHYLTVHTFSGATAHSSCVAIWVASLLLHNSVPICMQWSRLHGAAVHLTAISSGLTTNSYNHIEPQMIDNFNPHTCACLVSAVYMTTWNPTSSIPHTRKGPWYTTLRWVEDSIEPLTISAVYLPLKFKVKQNNLTEFYNTLRQQFIAGGHYNTKHTVWRFRTHHTSPPVNLHTGRTTRLSWLLHHKISE
jgi:hypothetical protein